MKTQLLTLLSFSLLITGCGDQSSKAQFEPPVLIAHAGGGVDNRIYLNSLQALNNNYQLGIRYFEVDFNWTSDGHLVLIHDWKKSYKRLFEANSETPPSKEEFLSMEMAFGQTQLSLEQFAHWMKDHPDAILIADVKSDNLKGLELILQTIEKPYQRVIPQLYKIENFEKILSLGFQEEQIMFTMYKTMKVDEGIRQFIQNTHLFAISIQPKKPYFESFMDQFGSAKTPIYTLTINDINRFKKFQQMGVDGTVTDFIYIKDGKFLSQKN